MAVEERRRAEARRRADVLWGQPRRRAAASSAAARRASLADSRDSRRAERDASLGDVGAGFAEKEARGAAGTELRRPPIAVGEGGAGLARNIAVLLWRRGVVGLLGGDRNVLLWRRRGVVGALRGGDRGGSATGGARAGGGDCG